MKRPSRKTVLLAVMVVTISVLTSVPVYSKSFIGCRTDLFTRQSMLLGSNKKSIDDAIARQVAENQNKDCNPKVITHNLYLI